jgi:PAS domain S-box-containing protein
VHRRLEPHPSTVAAARRLIRQTLAQLGREELAESAELAVSEVVTNALVHAGTPVELAVSVHDAGLRVEVTDGSPHLPSPRKYTALAGTGRGLRLLESLVDQWGVEPRDGGKTVWFQLNHSDQHETARHDMQISPTVASATRSPSPSDTVDVILLNVPLLLHSAWQIHAETVLREYLLSRLDDDTAQTEMASNAAANDAMALLHEHIPSAEVGDDPEAVMAAATEPHVSCERLVVPVPRASVPHFALLNDTLNAALDLTDSGRFLTPPTQPEVRALRRWLCGQVQTQSAGAAPTPWSTAAEEPQPPVRPQPAWDADAVTESSAALIAADDTNRILAANRAAADLLGYDEPSGLVGHRLVDIIPPRYRQAHLAGFTLHLSTGRSPLLGRPVVVPALRRDGQETMVELTVEARHLPQGRRMFVAELKGT